MAGLDLLSLVASERKAAIGFENDADLLKERQTSLEYLKGEMKDVPALPMRSKAVSTDVNDAIETVMPDLMEIFTGSDDVVAFTPVGEEDEDQAKQETDYINYVVFQENDGFMLLYTALKDALTSKAGIFTWWWEEYRYQTEEVEVTDVEQLQQLVLQSQSGRFEIVSAEPDEDEAKIKVTLKRPDGGGRVCIQAVPPENFAFAKDTVRLKDGTYCAMRSFPRAQDLIADGYDREKVASLPKYTHPDEAIERARDTAGESNTTNSSMLHQVEIVSHIIKVVDEKGQAKTWRVVTGADETILLDEKEIDHVNFASITPFPQTHRLLGRSLADLTMEIQRIRTSLLRMLLDSGYFALNQRHEVAEQRANANTIADLLRNEPGVPIRSDTGDSIRPISAGTLNFDVQGALEFTATMSEQRTGVMRYAQGLNPDTLHDTAKGAAQQLVGAMRRVRLMARQMAETGIRDMLLGVHATIRRHATKAEKVQLRNNWTDIDPTSWGSRKDMRIEIGVGAGGREYELQMVNQLADTIEKLLQTPNGAAMVTPENLYAIAKRSIETIGFKNAETFITDPSQVQQEPQQPEPNPEAEKAKADIEIARFKAENDLTLAREKMQLQAQLEREKAQLEAELRREQFQYEAQLKAQANFVDARNPETSIGPVRDGGVPG